MKIFYVKNNSERNPAFQLKTVIYSDKEGKFVKKEPLCQEAGEHFNGIARAHDALKKLLANSSMEPVPIIHSSEQAIVFPFVEGESFQSLFDKAYQTSLDHAVTFVSDYFNLLKASFPLEPFCAEQMVDEQFKKLFGEYDYARLDGLEAFKETTNLDLILPNLIQTENNRIVLIDYEWTFPLSLPLEYIFYRTLLLLPAEVSEKFLSNMDHLDLFEKMERHFIDRYVMKDGFYFYKYNYIKANVPVTELLDAKERHIDELKASAKENLRVANEMHKVAERLGEELQETGDDLTYARQMVAYRDWQLENARLSNRIKRLVAKLIPFYRAPVSEMQEPVHPAKKRKKGYRYRTPELTPQKKELLESLLKSKDAPTISILMPVYNVDPKWLHNAIESVKKQWYTKWELCIVDDKSTNEATLEYLRSLDDPRIKIKFSDVNKNIAGASNDAARMATGAYITLLDNDDELTPDALFEAVKTLYETDADFVYSDEDFIDTEGHCSNPHFKPDFSPDLLLSHNYITHLACFKKSLFDEVGGFDERFSGSQDYDLFLRMSEKTDNIHHIPKVLYHWRTIEGSTSADSKAKPEALKISKQVLEETLKRRGIDGWVEYGNIDHYFRVRYTIQNNPKVSIVIPFKDKPELLRMCVTSVLEKSTYENYEIIGISNNSEEETTFKTMKELAALDGRVTFYEYNVPFNYAQINNYAVNTYAKGEHILLLNNDIEVITSDWIEAMLEHSQRPEIGCVGAKLYYPDDTVQHAGIIIGLGGYAGHSHKHLPRESLGYFNRLNAVQNVTAVTAACLMVKTALYKEVNGMDEVKFKVAYNDVDFCLRIHKKGYRNLFTPYAELYHHESVSRGYETTPEKMARFQKEKDALYERHGDLLQQGDPFYNPNLTHDKEDFTPCLRRIEQNR